MNTGSPQLHRLRLRHVYYVSCDLVLCEYIHVNSHLMSLVQTCKCKFYNVLLTILFVFSICAVLMLFSLYLHVSVSVLLNTSCTCILLAYVHAFVCTWALTKWVTHWLFWALTAFNLGYCLRPLTI